MWTYEELQEYNDWLDGKNESLTKQLYDLQKEHKEVEVVGYSARDGEKSRVLVRYRGRI